MEGHWWVKMMVAWTRVMLSLQRSGPILGMFRRTQELKESRGAKDSFAFFICITPCTARWSHGKFRCEYIKWRCLWGLK